VPVAYEALIAEVFSPQRFPHLRTQELVIEWPDDWRLLGYKTKGGWARRRASPPGSRPASPVAGRRA
jgi:hypothetical protein